MVRGGRSRRRRSKPNEPVFPFCLGGGARGTGCSESDGALFQVNVVCLSNGGIMGQGLRDFIEQMKRNRPNEVVRVREEVDPKYEITGIMLEAERQGHFPLFIFDRVRGSNIPLVTGVISHRKRFADAFGVAVEQATQEYIKRSTTKIPPRDIGKAPFHANVQKGPQVDLTKLPLLTYFPVDPGPYITAA